mgnify:CR=1 FL=1
MIRIESNLVLVKIREIDFFAPVDFSGSIATPADPKAVRSADSQTVRSLRRSNPFILVIDLNNFEGGDLHFVQEAIRRIFTREKLIGSDLFMLFAIRDRLIRLTALTSNLEEIVSTVDSLRASATSISYKGLVENIARTFRVLVPAGLAEQAMEQSITDAKMFKMNVRGRIASTTRALGELAEYLEPIPGRKNLLLLSRGYPTNAGSVVYEIISAFNRGIYPLTIMSAKLGQSGDNKTLDQIRECNRKLNGSQIAVYCLDVKGVDPVGLANSPEASAIPRSLINRFNSEDQLSSMAFFNQISKSSTGLIFNRSNYESKMDQFLLEGYRYYLVGFQPTNKKEGHYTNVEVRISRPDVELRYRQGFIYRKIDDIEDRIIRTAIQFPRLHREFPLDTEIRGISERKVELGFNLPTNSLQFERRGGQLACTVGVYGVLIDSKGEWITGGNKYTFAREFPLNLDPERLKSLRTVGAPIRFDAAPGNYQLIVVVRQQPGGQLATSIEEISIR